MTDAGLQRVAFLAACVLILLALAPRAWALRSLYLDVSVRAQARAALERAVEENGWLLSDLSIESVGATSVRVSHRQHRRGPDPVSCHDLPLAGGDPAPCPES